MNTCAPGASAPTGSRAMRTRVTATSSSAQPVTATESATPVVPVSGVSNEPTGAADVPVPSVLSVTLIGPAVLDAPVKVSVTAPACVAANPGANCTETSIVADPVPDVGDTTSQGLVDTAVHVAAAVPVCVMRTDWVDVFDENAAPLETALNASEVRSAVTIGTVEHDVFSRIDTLAEPVFEKARSGFPSPLRSPIATR